MLGSLARYSLHKMCQLCVGVYSTAGIPFAPCFSALVSTTTSTSTCTVPVSSTPSFISGKFPPLDAGTLNLKDLEATQAQLAMLTKSVTLLTQKLFNHMSRHHQSFT